jgi:hypothetical protein
VSCPFLPGLPWREPRDHEVIHHDTLFELVFDWLRIVQTGRFEKFLEMVFWLLRLALEVALNGRDILFFRAVRFLVIVVIASSNYGPSGAPLLPLLPPLSPSLARLSEALNGVGDRFLIA